MDTPKPDNSSGATPASDDADGASTLPVNTAGTSAASQGAHLISVNICDTCGFCGYSGVDFVLYILVTYLTTSNMDKRSHLQFLMVLLTVPQLQVM